MDREFFGRPGPRRGPRMFGRGALKYALLDLLQERPKHGYEMMRELEDRTGGFYAPSAGAIYPTLQLLQDRGWVTAQEVDGRKVYAMTESGTSELAAFRERGEMPFGPPWARGHHPQHERDHEREHEHEHPGPRGRHEHERHEYERHEHSERRGPFEWGAEPEWRGLMREGRDVARLLRASALVASSDPMRQAELRGKLLAIVERARGELQTFLDEAGAEQQGHRAQQEPTSPSEPQPGSSDRIQGAQDDATEVL